MNYINDALMILTGFFLGFAICFHLLKNSFKKKSEKTITVDIEVNSDQAIKQINELTDKLKQVGKLADKVGLNSHA